MTIASTGQVAHRSESPGGAARVVWVAIAIALLAVGLRLGFALLPWQFIQQKLDLSRGSDGYDKIARTIVAGAGYKFAPHLGETMILLPTYPAFLAGIFVMLPDDRETQLLVTRIVQSVMDAATAVMLIALGWRWFGPRAGILAGLCYALYPGMWVACARYVTEPLFSFLIVAFVLLFVQWLDRRSVIALSAASVVCAAAALCKSVSPLLPLFLLACIVVLPFLWWSDWRRTALGLLACLATCGIASGAWIYRNHALTGEFVFPSTLGGQALYTATAYVGHTDLTIGDAVDQAAKEMSEIVRAHGIRLDPKDGYPRWFFDPRDEVRHDRLLQQIARERIAADSAGFARHVAGNLWRFWFGAPSWAAVAFSAVINGPLLLLGLVAVFSTRWWREPGLALWLAASAYLFLSHVGVLAVVRYSLTVIPMLCVLAAAVLCRAACARRDAPPRMERA